MYIQHVHLLYQTSRVKPSAPPVPNERDTLQFLDEVIASCDSEPKPYLDDGHADVDFIGGCESLGLYSSSYILRDACMHRLYIRCQLDRNSDL